MPAAHKVAAHGDHRQIMGEALEHGIAPRPTEAIDEDVGLTDCGNEPLSIEPRQHHAMVLRPQPDRVEGPVEALAKQGIGAVAPAIANKGALAARHFAGDAGKNHIVLGQILVERLAAPIDRRIRAQPKLGAAHRDRLHIERFVIDREVG